MSVNVFGLSGNNKLKSTVSKKNFDSKFINLTKNLQFKVNKSGDTLSGNLNMGNHKITDLGYPIADTDGVNKKFVTSEIKADSIKTKSYIDTLLHTKLEKNITENINMNGQRILGLENPIGDDEVCNKKYVDSNMRDDSIRVKIYIDDLFNNFENRLNLFDTDLNIQTDDITAEKIFDIGSVIKNFLKEKEINIDQFLKNFNYVEKMYEKYDEIFDEKTSENIPNIVKSCILYTDLKIAIIKVIEDLPKTIFIELKIELAKNDLLSTPEAKTLRKRCRRFINGMSKTVDPNRTNEALELLIQKNLLLIDLGYTYFIKSLLKNLLDDP